MIGEHVDVDQLRRLVTEWTDTARSEMLAIEPEDLDGDSDTDDLVERTEHAAIAATCLQLAGELAALLPAERSELVIDVDAGTMACPACGSDRIVEYSPVEEIRPCELIDTEPSIQGRPLAPLVRIRWLNEHTDADDGYPGCRRCGAELLWPAGIEIDYL